MVKTQENGEKSPRERSGRDRGARVRQILDLAGRGPVRSKDLASLGIPRAYLTRLVLQGKLEKVERGLYRSSDSPGSPLQSISDVATKIPNGTICLLSALQIHELTTEMPAAVWIMIDRAARSPRYEAVRLQVVRASGRAKTHGVEFRHIEGVRVRITSPAKTVADCFRYRRHVGMEVALAALKDFVARRGQKTGRRTKSSYDLEALTLAARADGVEARIRPYIEALL